MSDPAGSKPSSPLRIGPWLVEPHLSRIRRDETGQSQIKRHLEPRLIELLVFFAQHPKDVLSKEALIEGVWDGQYLSDSALTRSISELRRALEDDAQRPTFIETIPKRGYRLVAPVTRSGDVIEPSPSAPGEAPGVGTADRPRPHLRAPARRLPWLALAALAGLAGAALTLFALRTPDSSSLAGALDPPVVGLAQITSSAGLEAFPHTSPDGNRLVYSVDQNESFEIVIRQRGVGTEPLMLTNDGRQNVQPRWSPDGRFIVYHSVGAGGIWVIPALGGESRRLTEFGSWPSFSPDGSTIVFQSGSGFELGLNSYPATPPSTLWTIPFAGGEPRQLTEIGWPPGGHGGPSWSPDGQRIAFVSSEFRGGSIWTIRPDGKMARTVQVKATPREVAWAADSSALYFTARTLGERWLWEAPVSTDTGTATGEPTRLARAALRFGTVSDDRLVATRVEQNARLWSFPLDPDTGLPSGTPRPLTAGTHLRDSRPAFSPDGERIVFQQTRRGQLPSLYIMDKDGSNLTPLTLNEELSAYSPTWTRDGDSVLYFASTLEELWLYRIDVETRERERIVRINPMWRSARPSPLADRLAFYETPRSAAASVQLYSFETKNTTSIETEHDFVGFPVWSDDGAQIAVEIGSTQGFQIGVLSADGGILEQLTDSPGEHWPGGFSLDGDKVVYARARNGVWGIEWIDIESGEQVVVAPASDLSVYYRYPSWSPQGDQIVVEKAEIDLDLWEATLP